MLNILLYYVLFFVWWNAFEWRFWLGGRKGHAASGRPKKTWVLEVLSWLSLERERPFPQMDIIGAVVIVWRIRGKIIRSVLCSIVCNNCAQCEIHTLWTDLTVLWIGFCLTGPISLCLDLWLHVLCVLFYTVCMCRFVTWWRGPGGTEAYP